MRGPAAGRRIGRVASPVRMSLEIELVEGSVRGVVRRAGEDGEWRRFTGWMGLVAAIVEARGERGLAALAPGELLRGELGSSDAGPDVE